METVFDEIIVGAPLFSTPDKIEKGRIFIYKNNGTLDTDNPIVIPGTGSKGRYGSAIVNLGDINSDGFEDIAVSAPFESRGGGGGAEGTVYIYLGSGESVIVTTPEDEITAADISSRLGFDESRVLKSFGYSLSSGVDVDANAYNDLVIGDYIQQTVIVLRTHSIANVSLSLSTIPNELFDYRDTSTCATDFGSFACFTLEINASYSGRGLDGLLDTKVAVRENAVSAGSRLFFLDSDKNRTDVFEGFLNFSATDTPTTEPVTVYVEAVEKIDRRRPLAVEVSVSRVERVTPINHIVDGFQDIIDLRDYPLLEVLPQNNREQTLSLTGCENQDMCRPQLELNISGVRYLDSKKMATELEEIVAGRVSFIEVLLEYQTLTEDAVNSRLFLSLPPNLLGAPQSIQDTTGTAQATSQCQLNVEDDTYICAVRPIFSNYDGKFNVEIIIAVSDEVTGRDCVENCSAIFTIVNEDDNIADDSNNIARLNLSVSAMANVRITELSVNPNSTQYEDTNELKPVITTKVTLSNSGPSTIPESQVVILIPGKTDRTSNFYYLYPDTTRVPMSVVCSDLDPDGLNLNSQNQQRRRRRRSMAERLWRSVMGSEEEEEEEGGLKKRQEITGMVNCSRDPELCTAVVCNISDFSSTTISILVLSYVDNRFFRTQTGNFELYMHANFSITTSFVDGPPSSRTSNRLLVLEPQKSSSEEVPAWVIAVTVISAIITVFILVGIIILLYALGFFKRRDKEEFAKKQELQRSQSTRVASSSTGPAAAAKTSTTEPASLDSKPDEPPVDEATELNEKPPQPPTEEVAPEKTEALKKASSETEL
ncbi:Integrin alpha-5 [Geodia barretti]|uniref:Integrin alpha-5 n=1 Tax=Geodia barretti TaxID=519541 RepID=A0AA35SG43_GEOBA|nr:Integrin alpha-5 [Geodia barretti]